MMRLYDTHFHLDLQKNVKAAIEEINSNQIYTIAMTNLPVLYEKELRKYESSYIRIALGFHPELIVEYQKMIPAMWKLLPNARYVGEVGLDFTDNRYRNEQLSFFSELVERCRYDKTKLLSIHSRKAEKEVVEILKQGPICFRPILHWYSGNLTVLKEALEIGCYFSVNSRMLMSQKARRILEMIPVERLILETDSPFLSINVRHSNSLTDVIVKLAQLKSMPVEVVEKNLWHNFECILKNC